MFRPSVQPHSIDSIFELRRLNETSVSRRVRTVAVTGGSCAGKSTLIDATVASLLPRLRSESVVCGRDGKLKHLHPVHDFDKGIDVERTDFLFVEYENTVEDSGLITGQDATAVVFSVAAGVEKVGKHPELVQAADVVILNKIDLLNLLWFDTRRFYNDIHWLNPRARVIELSAETGKGLGQWTDWLMCRTRSLPAG